MLNYSCKALHNAVIRKFFKPSNVHAVANYYVCLYDQIEQINYIVLSNKPNSLYMNHITLPKDLRLPPLNVGMSKMMGLTPFEFGIGHSKTDKLQFPPSD